MNTLSRTTALVFSTSAVLLAACGGGGDDAAQPPAQIITTKEQVLAVFNAAGFGPASVRFSSVSGTLVENALPNFRSSAAPVQRNCFGSVGVAPGSESFTLTDADNSGAASAGDTVTMALNACVTSGTAVTGTATFRLTAATNLVGYYTGGTGSYAGTFNFGTLPASGYIVTGDLVMTEAYELRNGLRTRVSTSSASQLTFTGAAGTSSITSLFIDDFSDINVNVTNRFERTAVANVPGAGSLEFTSSVVETVRFPEEESVSNPTTGLLLLRNPGVDIRVTISAAGYSAAVDNGRDGSVEHTFPFTFAELDS
jgi:hypothetical protein